MKTIERYPRKFYSCFYFMKWIVFNLKIIEATIQNKGNGRVPGSPPLLFKHSDAWLTMEHESHTSSTLYLEKDLDAIKEHYSEMLRVYHKEKISMKKEHRLLFTKNKIILHSYIASTKKKVEWFIVKKNKEY